MQIGRYSRGVAGACALSLLGACGALSLGGANAADDAAPTRPDAGREESLESSSIWELFNNRATENTVSVNKYLWGASLEVLNFLPVQSIDPFTGVIVTGYGTPPGGGRAYRATVLIDDPALDARSLNVALQSRGGRAVSKATQRAVEDAILSRAREMRIADGRF